MIGGWPATADFYDVFRDSAMARVGLEPEWRPYSLTMWIRPRTGATPPREETRRLQTQGGGSSRQFLIVVGGNGTGRD